MPTAACWKMCANALGERENHEAIWIGNGWADGDRCDMRGARGGAGAGGESGDDDGEKPVDAIREEYGGGGRFDAGGEIWI